MRRAARGHLGDGKAANGAGADAADAFFLEAGGCWVPAKGRSKQDARAIGPTRMLARGVTSQDILLEIVAEETQGVKEKGIVQARFFLSAVGRRC